MIIRVLGLSALGLCFCPLALAAPTLATCTSSDDVPAAFYNAPLPNQASSPPFSGYYQLYWSSANPIEAAVYNSAFDDDTLHVLMLSKGSPRCAKIIDDGTLRMLDVRTGNQGDTIHLSHHSSGAGLHPTASSGYGALHVVVQARGGVDTIDTASSGDEAVYQYLIGGAGNDTIHGWSNTNCAIGGSMSTIGAPGVGDERTNFGTWCRAIAGGGTTIDGTDTIDLQGWTDQIAIGCEARDIITGGDGDDVLWGDLGDELGDDELALLGLTVTEQVMYSLWDDTISGGLGSDSIYGEWGDDDLDGGGSGDWLDGYVGDDLLLGGDDIDELSGGDGADELWGEEMGDTLAGGPGNDLLSGNTGDDTLSGGAGNDVLCGGGEHDSYNGEGGDNSLLHPVTSNPPAAGEAPLSSNAGSGGTNHCSAFSYSFGGGATLPFGTNPTGSCTNDLPTSVTDPAYLAYCPYGP